MLLKKINNILHKIAIRLSVINVIVGLLLGIAYVYLPFTSIFGLVLGIIMAISSSASMGMNYFFTSKNTRQNPQTNATDTAIKKKTVMKHTKASVAILCVGLPIAILSAASSFFGMYSGVLLLVAALALPIAPPVSIAIAVVLGCILAVNTLINLWLMTHNISEGLKQPVEIKETPGNDKPAERKTTKLNNRPIPTYSSLRKQTPYQRLSHFFGSFFRHRPNAIEYLPEKRERSSSAPPTITTSSKYCLK